MDKIPIIIPYVASEARGRELQLAVAGWRNFFLDPYEIIIVGDSDENVESVMPEDPAQSDVTFIHCQRLDIVYGKNYLPHLDMLRKICYVHECRPDIHYFIKSSDDMYPVKFFTLADVMIPKITRSEIPPMDPDKESGWMRELAVTSNVLRHRGYTTMDFTTHLPMYYNMDLLMHLIPLYNGTMQSYVWETLYYNIVYSSSADRQSLPEPILVTTDDEWRYVVCTANPGISRKMPKAKFINNANCGWSKELEEILMKHYGMKEE